MKDIAFILLKNLLIGVLVVKIKISNSDVKPNKTKMLSIINSNEQKIIKLIIFVLGSSRCNHEFAS
jgi:hypothetical protein